MTNTSSQSFHAATISSKTLAGTFTTKINVLFIRLDYLEAI
jgi:hypothetical protein